MNNNIYISYDNGKSININNINDTDLRVRINQYINEYKNSQYGSGAIESHNDNLSMDTNQLMDTFIDTNKSQLNLVGGGDNTSEVLETQSNETTELFNNFLDETQSNMTGGGDSDSMYTYDTKDLINTFLDVNASENISIESNMAGGGDLESVGTNQLFNQFLDENQSSMIGGGDLDSVNTNNLMNQFLDANPSESMMSESNMSGGGDLDSVNTNLLMDQFLDANPSENINMSLDMNGGGGLDSLQSVNTENTQNLFNNFLEEHQSIDVNKLVGSDLIGGGGSVSVLSQDLTSNDSDNTYNLFENFLENNNDDLNMNNKQLGAGGSDVNNDIDQTVNDLRDYYMNKYE